MVETYKPDTLKDMSVQFERLYLIVYKGRVIKNSGKASEEDLKNLQEFEDLIVRGLQIEKELKQGVTE